MSFPYEEKEVDRDKILMWCFGFIFVSLIFIGTILFITCPSRLDVRRAYIKEINACQTQVCIEKVKIKYGYK
jgi:hypothetical protein